jgi:hypothetical protein
MPPPLPGSPKQKAGQKETHVARAAGWQVVLTTVPQTRSLPLPVGGLSVVIVRACGRSSNHGKSDLARLYLNAPQVDYWMPRLKRGMTTQSSRAALRDSALRMRRGKRTFSATRICGNSE